MLNKNKCQVTGEYITRKIHTELGPKWWNCLILTSEDIDDVIPRAFTVLYNSQFAYIIKIKSHAVALRNEFYILVF